MKVFSLCAFVLLLIPYPSFGQDANPLVGAWELIYGKYNFPDNPEVIRNQPDRPFGFKVFSPEHFAFVNQDEDGTFSLASAGPYRMDGNRYIETHRWASNGTEVHTSAYEFRIKGDTLYMSGPISVVDVDGQEMELPFQLEEIRIRAR